MLIPDMPSLGNKVICRYPSALAGIQNCLVIAPVPVHCFSITYIEFWDQYVLVSS